MSKMSELHMTISSMGIEPETMTAKDIQRLQKMKVIDAIDSGNLQVQTKDWAALKAYSKTITREKKHG